jgi:Fic family protein
MSYNWQHKNWPDFQYDPSVVENIAMDFAMESSEVKGIVDGLPAEYQQETILEFMINEAIKTSEIEGEFYSRKDVMSSIKKRLGIHSKFDVIRDKKARGIAELMVEVRQNYSTPLSENLIKKWHKIVFENSIKINQGKYRTGTDPMQIISGRIGNEDIHFEAPASENVPQEMKQFVFWYNQNKITPRDLKNNLIKTSISHLYFESIHPFEDGNGRIGRAIAEKCLAESLGQPVIMSLSTAIENDKSAYYQALKTAQKSMEVTEWIYYFSQVIRDAQEQGKNLIQFTLKKTKFLDKYKSALNERQEKVVLKLLDYGIDGFEGGMSARKYKAIAKTSKATATRDLNELVKKGVLKSKGAGRGTHYELDL